MDIKEEVVKKFIQYYHEKGVDNRNLGALVGRVFQDFPNEQLAKCFDVLNMESSLLKKAAQEEKETTPVSAASKVDEDDETITVKIPKELYVKIAAPDKVQGIIEAIKEYYQIDL